MDDDELFSEVETVDVEGESKAERERPCIWVEVRPLWSSAKVDYPICMRE